MITSDTIVTYLRTNLTDPAIRGYPNAKNMHWIYVTKPNFSFSDIGYPMIFVGNNNLTTIGKTIGGTQKLRNTLVINVFANKSSHIDTLIQALNNVFLYNSSSSLAGMYDFELVSSQVVMNVIDNVDVYQLIYILTYKTYTR